MIVLNNVSASYLDGNTKKKVIENLDLVIKEKCNVSIMGSSGCGKTTLLKVIAGLKKIEEGSISYRGKKYTTPIPEISLLFQNYGLLDWKTAEENILLPIYLRRSQKDSEKFSQLVKDLGLEKCLHKYPSQLSGGEKQRVAIGRALMTECKFLLLDEAFSSLDFVTKERIQNHLKKVFMKRGVTIILVTHSMEEALFWGDKIIIFESSTSKTPHILENHKESCDKEDWKKKEKILKRIKRIQNEEIK